MTQSIWAAPRGIWGNDEWLSRRYQRTSLALGPEGLRANPEAAALLPFRAFA
ncbi:MAG TPA: hypothetical protein VIE66_01510 [Methylocella sp.]